MLIQKDYKFYAAHRNEELQDKCRNLHGHRYGIRCFFDVQRTGSYSTLFADFDDRIEPFLKRNYDHAMLINVHDALYETLCDHMLRTGESFKMVEFDAPTSVENLAYRLFTEISEMGFRLNRIEVRETDSSVVIYTHEDWVRDERYFVEGRRLVDDSTNCRQTKTEQRQGCEFSGTNS
jgi:6-pyruvoyltetrahydropterin/6-carboxytetrahydropterin synthase